MPATVARAPRRRSRFARQSLNTDPPCDIFTAHRVRDTITQALDDSTQPLDAAELVQRLIEIATLNAAAAD